MNKNIKTIRHEADTLKEFGIDFLTGEANGIMGMRRALYDLSIDGVRNICEFLGLVFKIEHIDNEYKAVGFAENWNSGIASVMLTTDMIKDLINFCYLKKYKAIYVCEDPNTRNDISYYLASNDDLKDSDMNGLHITGIITGESRAIHQMSGRKE